MESVLLRWKSERIPVHDKDGAILFAYDVPVPAKILIIGSVDLLRFSDTLKS
jgi:hypothetical protein